MEPFDNLAEINIFIILFEIIKIINNLFFSFYKINYHKLGFVIFKNNKITAAIESLNWNKIYYIRMDKYYRILPWNDLVDIETLFIFLGKTNIINIYIFKIDLYKIDIFCDNG